MHLILGGGGQLAHSFLRVLGAEAIALDRTQADLTQADALSRVLDEQRPAVVLNCAAYNQVDRAERDDSSAFAVNTLGPYSLARRCAERGIRLVHFSTNYVFGLDAERRTPYREEDLPGPQSVYAASKLAGEHLVQSAAPDSLIVRTCGLFGARAAGTPHANFVATMLRVARQGKPLRVVNDQVCTPTSTDDLARATLALLREKATGVFHVTNRGQCSWYEFAREIFAQAGIAAHLTGIPSSDYPVPAPRPAYSVLDCSRAEARAQIRIRTWQVALAEYLANAPLT